MTTETELKEDVRQLTGHTSTLSLSNDGLDTAFRTAQRHIRVEKSLDANFDWFNSDNPAAEEALFWFTCLFTKVQTGELDSQEVQIGAVELNTLLAKDNNDVTVWYRNAERAMSSMQASSIIQSSTPTRDDRTYEPDTFAREGGDSGGSDAEL